MIFISSDLVRAKDTASILNKKILLVTHRVVINIILSLIRGIKHDKNLDFGIKTIV